MNKLSSIVRFTFFNRLQSKAFKATTLIFALILTIAINLPALVDRFSGSDEPDRIGVVGKETEIASALKSYYESQENPNFLIVPLGDAGSPEANDNLGKAKIEAKEIKGYLLFSDDKAGGFPKATYKSRGSLDFGTASQLKNALQAIKYELAVQEMGLTAEQRAMLNAPVVVDTMQVLDGGAGGKTESQIAAAFGLVYILLILLYMTVIGYGNMVATEITSEKSSRVMEVLVASASPLKLMFGKIIAIGLLGIVQFFAIVLAALLNLAIPQNREMLQSFNMNLSDIQISLIFYFLVFYVLGFFIYATVFAAIGSLVSRTEEVAQAVTPAMVLIIAAFMVAMYGLQNPDAPMIVAMSYVPFFSPLIMFLRIGLSDPALWEIGLSIGITAISIFVLGWLAAKIYRVGVLLYGKRPSLRELRKAMKAFKV